MLAPTGHIYKIYLTFNISETKNKDIDRQYLYNLAIGKDQNDWNVFNQICFTRIISRFFVTYSGHYALRCHNLNYLRKIFVT